MKYLALALVMFLQQIHPPKPKFEASGIQSLPIASVFSIYGAESNGCPWGFSPNDEFCTFHLQFMNTGLVTCTPLEVVMEGDKIVHQTMTCTTPRIPPTKAKP